jgi:hypothetical protein
MKIVRYQTNEEGCQNMAGCWMTRSAKFREISFGEYRRREAKIPVGELKLACPLRAKQDPVCGTQLCGTRKGIRQRSSQSAAHLFETAFLNHSNGEHIVLPPQSSQVEHEAELVVVIGKRGRNITAENAKEYVFGYTIGNDITARDLQKTDGQWTRAKGLRYLLFLRPVDRHRVRRLRCRSHLPRERADAPDGIHPRHGFQHQHIDRLHFIRDDTGTRRYYFHRHTIGCGRIKERRYGGCGNRRAGQVEQPGENIISS